MKLSLPKSALLLLLGLAASTLHAEVVTEATVGSGYQSNLFYDSNATGDTYGSARVDLKYYPSASAQWTAGLSYDRYIDHGDLSNLSGDLSLTVIATPEMSRLALALSGRVAGRRFGPTYALYDQVGATVGAHLSFRLARWAYLQSSGSYLNTGYTNSESGSNRGFDIGSGVNLTFMGSNSLALRAEYSRRSFDQPVPMQTGGGRNSTVVQANSETFDVTGVTARFSRPLGARTGFNCVVGQRRLQVDNGYAVLGYTVDYLSPWADLWEGRSFSAGLKHFFPRQITAELSFGYYDKTFVDVVELSEDTGDTYWQDTREDRLTTLSCAVSRPISFRNGNLLTPRLNLGYRRNQSSTVFFDYEDFSAGLSLAVTL